MMMTLIVSPHGRRSVMVKSACCPSCLQGLDVSSTWIYDREQDHVIAAAG